MSVLPNRSGTPWHVREHEVNSEFEVVLLGECVGYRIRKIIIQFKFEGIGEIVGIGE